MDIIEIVDKVFQNLNRNHRSAAFSELQKESQMDHPEDLKTNLGILSGIFSMTLAPEDVARPFHPIWIGADGSTSFGLENVEAKHIDLLLDTANKMVDHGGKAQLYDICWISSRNFKCALSAIKEYNALINEQFSSKNLLPAVKPIERVLNLMRSLNNEDHKESEWIEHIIQEIALKSKEYVEHYNLTLNIFSILERRKLEEVSLLPLSTLAREYSELVKVNGQFFAEHDFLITAATFARKQGDDVKSIELLKLAAKVYEDAAEIQKESFAKCSLIEMAISDLRKVGGEQEKVQSLIKKLVEAQKGKLGALNRIKMPDFDISEGTKKAEAHVTRDNFIESVLFFANVSPLPNYTREKRNAEGVIQEFPFQHLFKKQILDHEAKTVAQVPGILPNGGTPNDQRKAVWDQVLTSVKIHQDLYTHGIIIPALVQINKLHEPAYYDLVRLFKSHPFVDLGREILIAKGIQYGFLHQWPEALHFLIPQLEHSIRFVLKNNGVVVSKYDDHGNQEDLNLNELIYKKEAREYFGEDLILDLSVLLVDKFGSNLRNLLAHGLMPVGHFYATDTIYLWWLITKYFFLPINIKSDS